MCDDAGTLSRRSDVLPPRLGVVFRRSLTPPPCPTARRRLSSPSPRSPSSPSCASFHLGMKSFFGFPVGARLFFFCGAAPFSTSHSLRLGSASVYAGDMRSKPARARHLLEANLVDRLERLGGDAQSDVALLLGPVHALVLQVHALELLVADVREGHGPAVVRLLARQHALAAGLAVNVCGDLRRRAGDGRAWVGWGGGIVSFGEAEARGGARRWARAGRAARGGRGGARGRVRASAPARRARARSRGARRASVSRRDKKGRATWRARGAKTLRPYPERRGPVARGGAQARGERRTLRGRVDLRGHRGRLRELRAELRELARHLRGRGGARGREGWARQDGMVETRRARKRSSGGTRGVAQIAAGSAAASSAAGSAASARAHRTAGFIVKDAADIVAAVRARRTTNSDARVARTEQTSEVRRARWRASF